MEIMQSNYHRERERLRNSLAQKNMEKESRISEMLERFYSDDLNEFISVDELKDLEIGKKYPVSDGVYFIPLDYNDEYMEFHTAIKGGYFYGVQWHDKMEICAVTKGEMVDKISGRRCKVGETIIFNKGRENRHKPGAYVDTESNVKFYL